MSNGFKLYTIIKKRIIAELTHKQAGMQVSIHPNGAKQGRVKLT